MVNLIPYFIPSSSFFRFQFEIILMFQTSTRTPLTTELSDVKQNLSNYNSRRYSNKPIITQSKSMQPTQSAGKRERENYNWFRLYFWLTEKKFLSKLCTAKKSVAFFIRL